MSKYEYKVTAGLRCMKGRIFRPGDKFFAANPNLAKGENAATCEFVGKVAEEKKPPEEKKTGKGKGGAEAAEKANAEADAKAKADAEAAEKAKAEADAKAKADDAK